MKLTDRITLVPFLHGRHAFADHVRKLCLQTRFDCIAVDLPEPFREPVLSALDELPMICAVIARGAVDPLYYIPIDPCDATIEAMRQAGQNRSTCAFIGHPRVRKSTPLPAMPDEHAIHDLGFDAYAALCLLALGNPEPGAPADEEAEYCAYRLHELSQRHSSILALVHLRLCTRTVHHFAQERSHNLSFDEPASFDFLRAYVNPDHLYFALGELPFVTGKYEQARYDVFAPDMDPVATVKDLFRETRDEYFGDRDRVLELSPARIQVALTYLRNLTVMSGSLMPSLFDIVIAAKGVGGDSYGVRMVKSARYYPYLPLEAGGPFVSVGIDKMVLPGEVNPREAVNLFKDTAMIWVNIPIKPDPSLEKKRRYRFHWNPLGMCSHVPEDRRIETFNAHLRRKALRVLTEDMVHVEKFTVSVKDGIDIRETLRNWHTGELYVKELPPARGDVDTVVIIFDKDHDGAYPHCATWYAEHDQESTLTFYATDPFEDMVGPGIARCRYGGLSLLFPPRSIPNVFEVTHDMVFDSLAHRLTYGALLFSQEKNVAYVAARKPDVTLRETARGLQKHLVWIPLNSFSAETLRRLGRFHILNGRVVRSWATRFIGD